MEAPDPLEDLLSELRRLRAEGVETVPVSQESLDILKRFAGATLAAPAGRSPRTAEPAPATIVRPSAPVPPSSAPRREPLAAPMPVAAKPVVQAPKVDDSAIPEPPRVEVPTKGSKAERLTALSELVKACPECRRHLKPGEIPMLGAGSPDADILFIGEVPTPVDMTAGFLFAGAEAAIFEGALKGMGLSRDTVYVSPLMRWRTASANGLVDRTPTARELAFCLPYLKSELAVVRPKVLVALGGTVFHALTGDKAKISDVRGVWREVHGLPLLPTYHPSYLVKNPSKGHKALFWDDMLAVMEKAGLPISDKQRSYSGKLRERD